MGGRMTLFTVQIETEGEVPSETELAKHIESAVPVSRLEDFRIKGVFVISVKTPEHLALAEELHELAQKHGVEEGSLDDLIHEAQSSEGSDINNGGLETQIEYLVGDSSTAPNLNAIRQMITEAIRENAKDGASKCHLCGTNEFDERLHIANDNQKVCDDCWDERMRA